MLQCSCRNGALTALASRCFTIYLVHVDVQVGRSVLGDGYDSNTDRKVKLLVVLDSHSGLYSSIK